MTETVFCEECDFVHSATRNLEPWKWRCVLAPVKPGFGFVSKNWAPHPPYAKCEYLNSNGDCGQFEPRREAPKGEEE